MQNISKYPSCSFTFTYLFVIFSLFSNLFKIILSIHFCGILKNLEEVYSDLDLLVICSKNEGTPVTIIEALASGCPVASTNVGGVSEVLENGRIGRLLPSEQSEFTRSLSVVISDIMEDRFKEMPNLDIREKTCETYSVDRLVQNIYKLYCE